MLDHGSLGLDGARGQAPFQWCSEACRMKSYRAYNRCESAHSPVGMKPSISDAT